MYQKTTLGNGLRLITSAHPQAGSVSLAIFLGAGPKYERPEQAGISHFLEHMVFKGTERWPTSQAVSAAIEGVGGLLNGGTDKEATVYWVKVASAHFRLALDVLAEMVLRPRMLVADVDRERPVIIEELKMCFDSPQHRVDALADELMWPGQPLGRDIAGSRETVSGLSHPDLAGYLAERYLPNSAVVAIAGGIVPGEVEQAVSETFCGWQRRRPLPGFAADNLQEAPRLRLEHRPTEQANLCLGLRGIPATHPDRFILDLLNAILGEGMSGRLFVEIREKRGLAYDIHSSASHYTDAGSVNVYAGVDPGRLRDAVSAILQELARLKEDITEAELARAREMTKGRLLLRMEDTRNVVSWLGSQELINNKVLTVDDVIARVEAITLADLARVAREMISSDRLCLAVVGPVTDAELGAEMLKV